MTLRPKRLVLAALVGTLAALTAWIGFQYTSAIRMARTRVASGSQVITTPCGPIEFAEAGDGPAVLVIHGAGGGFDQGMALAAPFVPKGHRVIAMSRFGYLRTPAPKQASVVLQADAHACLLDALGIRSAAVVGVSAGAPSALEFALEHPQRCTALVLIVPGWFPSREGVPQRVGPLTQAFFNWALRSDFAFWALARFFPSVAIGSVLGTPPDVVAAASATEQARVASLLWDILPISQRSAGLALETNLTVAPLSKPLDQLTVPTLTISAKDDLYGTWNTSQYIGRNVPHARFVGFAVGGHLLVGHTEEVTAAVARFLKENDDTGP